MILCTFEMHLSDKHCIYTVYILLGFGCCPLLLTYEEWFCIFLFLFFINSCPRYMGQQEICWKTAPKLCQTCSW